jgi:hypothetical protein
MESQEAALIAIARKDLLSHWVREEDFPVLLCQHTETINS